MITFWKQPGEKTYQRQSLDHNGLIHISREQAGIEMNLLRQLGYDILEGVDRTDVVKNTTLDSIDK